MVQQKRVPQLAKTYSERFSDPLERLRGLKIAGDVDHQAYYIVLEDQMRGCIGFVGTVFTNSRYSAREGGLLTCKRGRKAEKVVGKGHLTCKKGEEVREK